MKVTGSQRKSIEVELDDFTVRQIVISQFCEVFNIDEDMYIEDGMLVTDERNHTTFEFTHFPKKTIRKATEDDLIAIPTLKKLAETL